LRGTKELPELGLDQKAVDRFDKSMNDDLNTPEAFTVLFDLASDINKQASKDSDATTVQANTLRALGARMGLLQANPDDALQAAPEKEGAMSADEIDALIAERVSARDEKNWARSDEIRDLLAAAGVVLEDTNGKTTWRRG